MNAIQTPAFAQLDEGIANRIQARRHYDAMAPERRAELEAEWAEGEAANDRARIVAERRAIVEGR